MFFICLVESSGLFGLEGIRLSFDFPGVTG